MSSQDKSELFLHYWRILAPVTIVQSDCEYHFDHVLRRKHRFDFAFIDAKLAIEIDGGQFKPRGGRHATELDKEKMNFAAMLGWRVMHYTPQMIERDPQTVINQVIAALNQKSIGSI